MPHTTKHRQARTAGGSVAAKCPYPDCALDEYHDGEHSKRGTRPRGAVRFIQAVNTVWMCVEYIHCEQCAPVARILASGLYVDTAGNGWLLCSLCVLRVNHRGENASQ